VARASAAKLIDRLNMKNGGPKSAVASSVNQFLKEIVAVGAIELPGLHAAVLEISSRSRTGKGHSDPVSPAALCRR